MFADLGNEIRSEGYEVNGSNSGSIQTISLHNEHNINCKLFAITYDTAGNNIKRLYARMTNIQEPLNKDKEKLVDIAISEWDNRAALAKYYNGDVVTKINGSWKATGIYKNYAITTLE